MYSVLTMHTSDRLELRLQYPSIRYPVYTDRGRVYYSGAEDSAMSDSYFMAHRAKSMWQHSITAEVSDRLYTDTLVSSTVLTTPDERKKKRKHWKQIFEATWLDRAFLRFFEVWKKGTANDIQRGLAGKHLLRLSINGRIGGNSSAGKLKKLEGERWKLEGYALYPNITRLPRSGITAIEDYARYLREVRKGLAKGAYKPKVLTSEPEIDTVLRELDALHNVTIVEGPSSTAIWWGGHWVEIEDTTKLSAIFNETGIVSCEDAEYLDLEYENCGKCGNEGCRIGFCMERASFIANAEDDGLWFPDNLPEDV